MHVLVMDSRSQVDSQGTGEFCFRTKLDGFDNQRRFVVMENGIQLCRARVF